MQQLFREEPDERVRCEILGAASVLDASPALRTLFDESTRSAQPSRVREVGLDLWLTVFPDEGAKVARRFLRDPDLRVQGVAEEFFDARKEDAREKSAGE